MLNLSLDLDQSGLTQLCGVPEGFDALVLAALAARAGERGVLHVCRDDVRMAALADALEVFAPNMDVLSFPAWDTVPYDRVSPNLDIISQRMDVLGRLAEGQNTPLLLTTVSAATQRLPLKESLAGALFSTRAGNVLDTDALTRFLRSNGYGRAEQVMEPGEYAVRGGLMDLFPTGMSEPVRLDLFGDELESIRTFDPMTQRATGTVDDLTLRPMSEVILDDPSISRFRSGYREYFGAVKRDDALYEAVSAGRKFPGMEHWLPLFHDGLDTLFAYHPNAVISLDHRLDEALEGRMSVVQDYFEARKTITAKGVAEVGSLYNPVPTDLMFLSRPEWDRLLKARPTFAFSPYDAPDVGSEAHDGGGRPGVDFAEARARPDANVYEALKETAACEKKVVVTAATGGACDRLSTVMGEHGLSAIILDTWEDRTALKPGQVGLLALELERGFRFDGVLVVSEQDLLGDRLVRPGHRRKKGAQNFIADISALGEGDLVVHVEHGIGRFEGLETLNVGGASHDCLRLVYGGGDKLFVPVENIDVLSRYGSEETASSLDKLGSVNWQARKAKLKERIRDMADKLIKVAAARHMKPGEIMVPPEGLADEFAARFPFVETEDQLRAITDTLADLSAGKPMDRLICGDVGFGKTEVAMRAAFSAAMNAFQVAVVVPTTLLARQHYKTFTERFQGLPVRVEQLSRLVTGKRAEAVKQGLADGTVDIVIGTHALLAKSIKYSNIGLLIVDEEQHFGVAHKEQLKEIRADVHVLTLTATPIPRTLQLALTGVRELSIIASPPVDRLAVRTFILPFDPVVIREAIVRERFRGGQCFYVCPRVADIGGVVKSLASMVPDLKVAIAHGQMTPTDLEDVMNAFADGKYDILVSTNIIESGIDMPSVNTIIMHRADMFGLAGLYQLRGRVGRSKARGYAYLTLPPGKTLTKTAERRLHVMQTLDNLGAGFNLASHDLDIRGSGNLLGDEQSGHIKEVGIELYQRLLEEAVQAAKEGTVEGATAPEPDWAPQIALGLPVLIPDHYVKDLGLRLGLYRRIAGLRQNQEIDELAAELVDRFGKIPEEVENLLEVISLKSLCLMANVEKIDAGPKGAVVTFRDNKFPNPAGLVGYIARHMATVKVRPDHKVVIMRPWSDKKIRVGGVRQIMSSLAEIAAQDP